MEKDLSATVNTLDAQHGGLNWRLGGGEDSAKMTHAWNYSRLLSLTKKADNGRPKLRLRRWGQGVPATCLMPETSCE